MSTQPIELPVEEKLALLALIEFARAGMLCCCCCEDGAEMPCIHEQLRLNCHCHAEGKAMPCGHVRQAAEDPAILLILQEEKRRGRGPHALDFASESLASDPQHEDQYGSAAPLEATCSDPSTPAKQEVLRQRVKLHLSVEHPQDAHVPPQRRRVSRLGKPLARKKKQELQMKKEGY